MTPARGDQVSNPFEAGLLIPRGAVVAVARLARLVSNPFEAGLLIPPGPHGPGVEHPGPVFQTPLKRGC